MLVFTRQVYRVNPPIPKTGVKYNSNIYMHATIALYKELLMSSITIGRYVNKKGEMFEKKII